jgi:hypothetical protein
MNQIPHGSESFRKKNPHLFRPGQAVVTEPVSKQALDGGIKVQKQSEGKLPIIVTLIALRRRKVDDDGNIGSLKWHRDECAKILGIDDGDSRFQWQYGQQKTEGEEGVMIQIEM